MEPLLPDGYRCSSAPEARKPDTLSAGLAPLNFLTPQWCARGAGGCCRKKAANLLPFLTAELDGIPEQTPLAPGQSLTSSVDRKWLTSHWPRTYPRTPLKVLSDPCWTQGQASRSEEEKLMEGKLDPLQNLRDFRLHIGRRVLVTDKGHAKFQSRT